MNSACSIAFLLSLATASLAAVPNNSPFAGEYNNSFFVGTTIRITIKPSGSITGRSVVNNQVVLRGSVANNGSMTVAWDDGNRDSGQAQLVTLPGNPALDFVGTRTSPTNVVSSISYSWYGPTTGGSGGNGGNAGGNGGGNGNGVPPGSMFPQ